MLCSDCHKLIEKDKEIWVANGRTALPVCLPCADKRKEEAKTTVLILVSILVITLTVFLLIFIPIIYN